MIELTKQALPGDLLNQVKLIRNPCGNCYRGNQKEIPGGVYEEIHTKNPHWNIRGGIITNDGRELLYPGEKSLYKPQFSIHDPEFASARNKAGERECDFITWDANLQGLRPSGSDPYTRNYGRMSSSEEAIWIDFIRG
jgi:hypothetical protein